jgi:hypothetical protein
LGGQCHAPAALSPGKRAGTHCIGGWFTIGLTNDPSAVDTRDELPKKIGELLILMMLVTDYKIVYIIIS